MSHKELIRKVASITSLEQVQAKAAIEALVAIVKESLMSDTEITIKGLGKFSLSHRNAREGFNPSTEEPIHIPAMKTTRFKACADIKRSVKHVGL